MSEQTTKHVSGTIRPDALIEAAWQEAVKAMRKYPQPNYVITKVAEEAGEVVKAAIHCAEGREAPEAVAGEIKQAMAMLMRLYVEGDQVHGLAPVAAIQPDPEPDFAARVTRPLTPAETDALRFVSIGPAGQPRLVIGHQSFDLCNDGRPWDRERAEWYCAMLAIALARVAIQTEPPQPVAGLTPRYAKLLAEVQDSARRLREAGFGHLIGDDTTFVEKAANPEHAINRKPGISGGAGTVSVEAAGWQPIETAPRDGTWFLACIKDAGPYKPRLVHFADAYDRFPINDEAACWSRAPTHWMPLPEPPALRALAGERG